MTARLDDEPTPQSADIDLALSYYETMREGEMNKHQRIVRAGLREALRLRPLFTPETVRALDMGSTALAEVGSKLIYANGATYSRIECNNAAAALRALASAVREHSRAHVARRGK